MMTTLSIDSMTTIPCASAGDATPLPATPSAAVDLSPLPHPALAEEQTPFGGLAEMVADNAALGEALQSLVSSLDMPRQVDVVAAEGKPAVSVDPALVAAANLKPAVDAGDRPEAAVIPAVAAKVVAVDAPTADAASSPRQTGEVPFFERREGEFASATVAAKPGAAVAESKSRSVSDASEPVVLQAAPVVSAPTGDPVAPVRESGAEAVSAVSRVAPIDVSTMFLAAAEEVAAAVTVSPALMRGEAGEIRVQLRPDVLEGAEVVVAVDGKKMEVTFVPTVTHVADALASNQVVMQQQLAVRIQGFEVSVGVVQTVATNVAVNVGSERAAQLAADRMRKTNGRA